MDPLTKAIDQTEALMGHSPHPAIVALPLGAWTVSALSDCLYILTGRQQYEDSARVSMAIGLAGAAGAIATGLRDYSRIPSQRQPSHAIATQHAMGNAVVATLFSTSYILRSRRYHQDRSAGLLARGLCLAGAALSAYTGWLGGKLVEELGEAVKPVQEHNAMPDAMPANTAAPASAGAAML